MNDRKLKAIKIQFIIMSLLPLLALALPFVKIAGSMSVSGQSESYNETLTGIQILTSIKDMGVEFPEGFENLKIYIAGLVLAFVIPLVLFILSAIFGVLSLKKNYLSRKLAVAPFAAVILSGGLLTVCTKAIEKNVPEDFKIFLESNGISDALDMFANISGVVADIIDLIGGLWGAIGGSLINYVGEHAGNLIDSIDITINFSSGAGFWLFIIVGLVLGIEVIVFGGQKQEAAAGTDYQNLFKNLRHRKGQNGNGQGARNVGYLPQKSVGRSGKLIGVRGEYQGAQIEIQSGEKVYIGRSSQCNLILSNEKVSRKHCMVSYDAMKDRYLLINYSGNGTYLRTGQRLDQEKVCHIPHGTAFLVTRYDEFRVL